MNRRFFGVALTLPFICPTLVGCDLLHHNLRQKDVDPDVKNAMAEKVESDGDQVLDVRSEGKKPQPFFRSSRLAGGLSSEAREIEGDMGIH